MYIYICFVIFGENNLIHSPAFSGEKRSQKDGCWKIQKEVGPPLGSNRLPRRMMPSTTAVSILVTVKSHWGATPLRDGNGRCPGFSSWGGASSCHRCLFPDSNPDFWMNHMAIVIFPIFKEEIYLHLSFMIAFSSQIFFTKGPKIVRRVPNPKSPPWGSEVRSCTPWIPG